MPELNADVLVIGAGPIGLTAACLLADQGLSVTLVERATSTSDLPRAISATDETLRIMEEIGVLDQLAPQMLLNTGARYYGRKDQLLAEVNPEREILGQPGKSQFDQPVMEQLLHEAALKRPGIDCRFATEAFTIKQDEHQATTTVIDDAGKHTIRSSYVVAADGARSPIRTQMGITLEGSTQVQKWIVLDIVNSAIPPEPFSEFHCNGTRPVVIVPGIGGRRRYEFMLFEGENDKDVTRDEFILELVKPYERISSSQIRRAAVYVAHQRIATTYRRGRVVLIGDAAHLMPPFAGQALNAGTRDAANVAWKLAAVIKHGAPDTLIDTYQAERRPHALAMVRLSHLIGMAVMATGNKKPLIRDALLNATGVAPRLKSWITGMKFLKQPHFKHGVVLKPAAGLPSHLRAMVGQALPQPTLSDVSATFSDIPDRSELALDRLLGRGWAVVSRTSASRPGDSRINLVHVGSLNRASGIDRQGLLDHLSPGYCAIVRPDRYVAAVIARHEVPTALSELAVFDPRLSEGGAHHVLGTN